MPPKPPNAGHNLGPAGSGNHGFYALYERVTGVDVDTGILVVEVPLDHLMRGNF